MNLPDNLRWSFAVWYCRKRVWRLTAHGWASILNGAENRAYRKAKILEIGDPALIDMCKLKVQKIQEGPREDKLVVLLHGKEIALNKSAMKKLIKKVAERK